MANRLYGAMAATRSRELATTAVTQPVPGGLRGFIPCLMLAALGLGLALFQTRFGPGAGGDSSSYLMGAENLLNGNGFSRYSGGYEIRPITGFPPFFSTVLAAIGLVGIDLQTASRCLNALLFGANILLAGYLVYAFSASAWAAAVASAFLLMADTMFELHSWVMSEPLYVFLTLAAIASLLRAVDDRGRGWLMAAALLTACSSLTRYVGPALSAAGAAVLLVFGTGSPRRRAGQAVLFAALSLLPLAFWLQRNAAAAGTLVNRDLAYHPMDSDLVRLFLAEIGSWFVPHQVPLPTGVRAGLAVLIASGLLGWFFLGPVRDWMRPWLGPARPQAGHAAAPPVAGQETAHPAALPVLLALYLAGSLLILFVNSTLLDASTTATAPPRYLAPIFAGLVPLACAAGAMLARRQPGGRLLGGLALAYTGVVLVFYAGIVLGLLRDPLPQLGYTGRRQLWAEAVAAIRQVPPDIPLVSNNPELIYILVDRPAYVRPISFDQYEQAERTDYEQQFDTLRSQVRRGGVFVLFDELEPDDQAFIERMKLTPSESFPRVRLYRIPAAGA